MAHGDAPGIVAFPPTIGWSISLFQRPHQLARSFAKRGWLAFFGIDDTIHRVQRFEQVDTNLYLARFPDVVFAEAASPLVFTLPYNCGYLSHFRQPHVIYEVIDEIEVFSGDQAQWRRNHERMLREADLVLVTADRLMDVVQPVRSDAILCPNAGDYEHFAAAAEKGSASPPRDLERILKRNHPIIGYYGALAEWFNYDLIRQAAQKRPDWEIVLIGPDYDKSLGAS
ncbi:MAG: hypothetical protein ACK2T0_04315, partial [Anaerolineales bacterium]